MNWHEFMRIYTDFLCISSIHVEYTLIFYESTRIYENIQYFLCISSIHVEYTLIFYESTRISKNTQYFLCISSIHVELTQIYENIQ
jgi:hypothetical protein